MCVFNCFQMQAKIHAYTEKLNNALTKVKLLHNVAYLRSKLLPLFASY